MRGPQCWEGLPEKGPSPRAGQPQDSWLTDVAYRCLVWFPGTCMSQGMWLGLRACSLPEAPRVPGGAEA